MIHLNWLRLWLGLCLTITVPSMQAQEQLHEPDRTSVIDPEINRDFLDPNMDVDRFVQRFELESREIYQSRFAILQACRIRPGMRVADIGAGTGFFAKLFAKEVENDGWVYALDIAPRFIEHIRSELDKHQIRNVSPVLTSNVRASLAPGTIDLAFICDTYHHFEHPQETMESILAALVPEGELIVIDFERIEGVSREWVLNHVRGGKADFKSEIEGAGFEFVEEIKIPSFSENYMMRFRKP